MMKKVQYLLFILAIILILVFAQRHFLFNSKKNSAYNYISRQIGLNTKKGLPKGQKSFKKLGKWKTHKAYKGSTNAIARRWSRNG